MMFLYLYYLYIDNFDFGNFFVLYVLYLKNNNK